MKYTFTESEIAAELNKLEVEDVLFSAEYVEGEGKRYRATGSALIEGETYAEFCIEFETENVPKDCLTASGILSEEWVEYDFIFDIK